MWTKRIEIEMCWPSHRHKNAYVLFVRWACDKKKLLLTNACRLSRNLCKFQNAFCQFLIFLQMEKRRKKTIPKPKRISHFACTVTSISFCLSVFFFFCSFASFFFLSNIQLKTSFNKQTNHSIWFDGLFSLGIGASVKSEYTE